MTLQDDARQRLRDAASVSRYFWPKVACLPFLGAYRLRLHHG